MKLKKILIALLAVLSLTSVVGCNSDDTIYAEDGVTIIESVSGKETKTTHTVDFYYNQPEMGIYKRYYVEDGKTIRPFICLISGMTYQGFYYDQYGQEEFSFSTPITSDLKLYAYHLGNGQAPGVYEYEEQGEYKINWGRVNGASYVEADGNMLPLSADKDAVVKFKLAVKAGTNKTFGVLCNGKKITPNEEGVYSVTVTQNMRIVTSIEETTSVTYYVENNPDKLQEDGCVIFGWVWEEGKEGEWVPATLEGNTFSFTSDKELAGFLFVRCVRGTTTPNWSNKSNTPGRIYHQTIDFICIPGKTVYDGSNAWKDYN